MKNVFIVLCILLFTSCGSNSESSDQKTTSLSLSLNKERAKSTNPNIEITSVKLLLKSIKFENAENDSLDFKSDRIIVTIDSNANSKEIAVSDLPAGTYTKVKFHIHKPDGNEDVGDTDFQDDSGRYSMVIHGNYSGEAFTFKTKKTMKQKIALDPVMVVADSIPTVGATININSANWFIDGDAILDPRVEKNYTAIEKNIKKSFKAFRNTKNTGK